MKKRMRKKQISFEKGIQITVYKFPPYSNLKKFCSRLSGKLYVTENSTEPRMKIISNQKSFT